jgi:FkbM family methyltransferase
MEFIERATRQRQAAQLREEITRKALIERLRRNRKIQRNMSLNRAAGQAYRPEWNWDKFVGSDACLKWSFRDLQNLEATLLLTPGRSIVVQAGGNLGLFPKRLAESFERVHTFEADPELYRACRANAPEPNITAYNAAIGNSNDPVGVRCSRRDNSGRDVHEGLTHIHGGGRIRQIRVDDLDLHACDLIYLDIEGYEFNALRGAVQTIAKYSPVITVEINRSITHYGSSEGELRAWLADLGYAEALKLHSDYTFVRG